MVPLWFNVISKYCTVYTLYCLFPHWFNIISLYCTQFVLHVSSLVQYYIIELHSVHNLYCMVPLWAQNLRQGIVMKTSFKSRVSQMGLGSFVNFNIFVMKYYFLSLFTFSILFEFVKSKSTEMLRPQKGNSGVSFKDFLLNFGLWGKLLNLILFLSLWSFPKRMRLQRRLYRMSWPFFFLQRRLYSMSSVVLSSEM